MSTAMDTTPHQSPRATTGTTRTLPRGRRRRGRRTTTTEHHVSPWQLNVAILFVLLFFTFLTVVSRQGRGHPDHLHRLPITQLWNVIIAMSIATVKAMLVCMYFMHLRTTTRSTA
jgi:caa(3)-type oxidase subunit IV